MQPLHDETVFDWIQSRRDELPVPGPGVLVTHRMPPVFAAYARILHRMDAQYEEVDQPLSSREKDILRIPSCEPLRSFVEQRKAKGQDSKIRWRELAELLNVPYVPEISHAWFLKKLEDPWCMSRFLSGATDSDRKEERRTLISHLSSYTAAEECFFRFSDTPFYASPNADMPRLFKGTLNDFNALPDMGPYRGGPEYSWLSDKKWCVCSDYDLQATIVGGPKPLISSLLTSDVLECLEASPQSRIDPFAPMP